MNQLLELAQQQVRDLAVSYYNLYKPIATSSNKHAPEDSGLFTSRELDSFHWVDQNPEIQHVLQEYIQHQDEMNRLDEATVRYWKDGSIATRAAHEEGLKEHQFAEGLNAVTTNVFGAAGMYLGMWLYPHDVEMQNRVASLCAHLGETALTVAETVTTRYEQKEYKPTPPYGELYNPDLKGPDRSKSVPDPGQNLPGFTTFKPENVEYGGSRVQETQNRDPAPYGTGGDGDWLSALPLPDHLGGMPIDEGQTVPVGLDDPGAPSDPPDHSDQIANFTTEHNEAVQVGPYDPGAPGHAPDHSDQIANFTTEHNEAVQVEAPDPGESGGADPGG